MSSSGPETPTTFQPRWPTLVAFGVLVVFVLALCLPMFAGRFLVGPYSDQIWTGVPYRWFGASEWRRTGSVPLWNPYIFGGMPFVAAMHGDIFYPTAWLRLALPIDVAMNLGFALHLVLAGWFAYLFLRELEVSWTGSVVGALAYQLSGSLASLVQPGHDGKLFVSAIMPVILIGLLRGIRRRRLEGYAIVALGVAMGILSPHIQMMQYSLILAGLFALWLSFVDEQRPAALGARLTGLGLALAAVLLGLGAGMIQLYPFIKYLPYAARSAGAQGWDYATSWSMPPENIFDWFSSDFTGFGASYWGSNFAKLNSEYLGAGTIALAAVGLAGPGRRKLITFLGGAGLLFLLVSLGGHTPFYRVWYGLVPGVKVTRAAGMAFFIPTFIAACFAAFGVERLERGEGRKTLIGALVGAGVLLLLGVSGALGSLAESIALGFQHDELARRHADAITFGALRSSVAAALVAGAGLALLAGKLPVRGFAAALALVVGADLFVNARPYFTWSPAAHQLYADDSLTLRMAKTAPPYRVYDFPAEYGGYQGAFLMAKQVPQVLGHHGNELDAYDKLLGGKNEWRNVLNSPRLWDLLAVRFVTLTAPVPLPGYHPVGRRLVSSGEVTMYEADSAPRYARVIPAAVKVRAEQIPPTLMDPRLDYNSLLLLDESAAGIDTPTLDSLPPHSTAAATVRHWEPGRMTVALDPAPARDAWLLVSENWYPDWQATVDGRPARTVRGDGTFLSVPLPAGARQVELVFGRGTYQRGKAITLACFAAIGLWLLVPPILRGRQARG
jgi:hypothetical protein